jgi:hypothetical protein
MKQDAFNENEKLFFEDPTYRKPPGEYGILYLLRRDINLCLENEKDPDLGIAQFPGAMAIMAGIDLLAKFYKGDDPSVHFSCDLNLYRRMAAGILDSMGGVKLKITTSLGLIFIKVRKISY